MKKQPNGLQFSAESSIRSERGATGSANSAVVRPPSFFWRCLGTSSYLVAYPGFSSYGGEMGRLELGGFSFAERLELCLSLSLSLYPLT